VRFTLPFTVGVILRAFLFSHFVFLVAMRRCSLYFFIRIYALFFSVRSLPHDTGPFRLRRFYPPLCTATDFFPYFSPVFHPCSCHRVPASHPSQAPDSFLLTPYCDISRTAADLPLVPVCTRLFVCSTSQTATALVTHFGLLVCRCWIYSRCV